MKALFAPLGRASTYIRLAYLLLGLPIGIFYFVFVPRQLASLSPLDTREAAARFQER